MEGCADCKVCNDGVLLPFYSPDGLVVYFCNNCRSRFSAYYEEPMMDGAPVFTSIAYYIREEDLDEDDTLTKGEMLDEFKRILEENPPEPVNDGVCVNCSGPLNINGECVDLCYLPDV